MDLRRPQRKKYLSCTTDIAEARKDQPDHFLQALIRIEIQTKLTMPDITYRHADS